MTTTSNRSLKARIDRGWLPKTTRVFIVWDDIETDVVDDETGCVVYSRPTISRALETAVAFCRRHRLTIVRVDVTERDGVIAVPLHKPAPCYCDSAAQVGEHADFCPAFTEGEVLP